MLRSASAYWKEPWRDYSLRGKMPLHRGTTLFLATLKEGVTALGCPCIQQVLYMDRSCYAAMQNSLRHRLRLRVGEIG